MNTKITIGLLVAGAIVLACGCQTTSPPPTSSAGKDEVKKMSSESAKGGSQLWAENCTRCHNVRPPDYYSDAQWSVITHHMRLRANLTGEETRKITQFLQSAN
jgi:cytochrome c5